MSNFSLISLNQGLLNLDSSVEFNLARLTLLSIQASASVQLIVEFKIWFHNFKEVLQCLGSITTLYQEIFKILIKYELLLTASVIY